MSSNYIHKYQLSSNQASSSISNETVILNHKDGIYYSLNEVGTFIWEQIKLKPHSLEEIEQAILKEFEVDIDTARKDINHILTELVNEKLLELR